MIMSRNSERSQHGGGWTAAAALSPVEGMAIVQSRPQSGVALRLPPHFTFELLLDKKWGAT
jgi:hypothetical protein